ncbi:tetratricopeptide repeat protein [Pseudoroseomonas cervicalis]|uniref:tetratricopeptide repeat protein n=1 Tax=Teichococcus cervicalis TaxID=204525 RepID=UPI00278939D7|nr:tetratricopeptide repeat protein [Pseudoroseomonas cervicalis]MDQ1078305.1 tetratricopeptide (TPR) repeat protein [Pseudoroseomonas cervicalis]
MDGSRVPRERLHQAEHSRVYYQRTPHRDSPVLVITFDAMYNEDSADTLGFGEEFLIGAGYDVLAVRKTHDNWYQDLAAEDLARIVDGLPRRYPRLYTYGASMGAYAAAYFAGAVGARIIAFSPLASIDPEYRRHVVNRDTLRKGIRFRHGRLAPMLARAPGPHLITYDPCSRFDRVYVEREIAPHLPQGHLIRQRWFGHPTIAILAEMRVLKRTILDFIEQDLLPPRHWGAQRRQSYSYLSNLAQALGQRGRWAVARRLLAEAVALRPAHAGLRRQLGEALGQLGEAEAGLAELRQAVALQPRDAALHHALARALRQQGQAAEALQAIGTALRLDAPNIGYHRLQAEILEQDGQAEAALAVAHRLAAAEPGKLDHWLFLGGLQWRLGRLEESLATGQQALRVDPESGKALHLVARALAGLGRWREALPQARAALRRSPRGDYRRLLKQIEQALATPPAGGPG